MGYGVWGMGYGVWGIEYGKELAINGLLNQKIYC